MHRSELMQNGWTPTSGPLYDWKLRIKVHKLTCHVSVRVARVPQR